ncbi:MAG: hypothetical protein R2827_03695 [Bdellovibrionales bacterium]
MRLKKFISILALSSILVLFQNCDNPEVGFDEINNPSTSNPLNDDELGNNDGDPSGLVGNGDPSMANPEDPTQSLDGYEPPNFDNCSTFVEIPEGMTVIPAYDAQRICYYKKLMSARTQEKSGTRGEIRTDNVIADNHDDTVNNVDQGGVIEPYELADVSFNFRLAGLRRVAFTGKYDDANADMKIDNFFLVELSGPQNSSVWAYGTADAEPKDGKILLNGEPVENFYSFVPWGLATLTAIDVTSSVPFNADLSFRFRALDCGGMAEGSDVYLVFY